MQSKLFELASDKISKKLKNIKPEDIEKVVNTISKTYQKMSSSKNKNQPPEVDEHLPLADDGVHNSMESVFFECTTGPPKPNRLLPSSPEPPPRKSKVTDQCLDSFSKDRESLLGNSRETLKMPFLEANGNCAPKDEAYFNFPQMTGVPDKPDSIAMMKLENAELAKKGPNSNNDYSNFVQKKSIAQGMMDLALVSANTNQLRYVIDMNHEHPYFLTSLTLIIGSLILQVAVGLALLYSNRFNLRKQNEMKMADRVNNLSIIGVFMITLINVFISTFNGSGSHPTPPPATNSTGCPVCPTLPVPVGAEADWHD